MYSFGFCIDRLKRWDQLRHLNPRASILVPYFWSTKLLLFVAGQIFGGDN